VWNKLALYLSLRLLTRLEFVSKTCDTASPSSPHVCDDLLSVPFSLHHLDMPVFALTVGSLGDILATAGLAIKIVKALHESGHSSAECDVLTLELQALQKVLILTEYAIQHYKSSALGQILANVVGPEVAQCHLAMQGFATEIDTYRQVLGSTVIGRLWGRVVWTMSDKVVSLQAKLTSHRGKLSMILVALNSFVSSFMCVVFENC